VRVGAYCGARWWRPRDWKLYGLYRIVPGVGFSIGPILFSHDD